MVNIILITEYLAEVFGNPVIESALGEIHSMCVWLSMNRCESEAGDKSFLKQL